MTTQIKIKEDNLKENQKKIDKEAEFIKRRWLPFLTRFRTESEELLKELRRQSPQSS